MGGKGGDIYCLSVCPSKCSKTHKSFDATFRTCAYLIDHEQMWTLTVPRDVCPRGVNRCGPSMRVDGLGFFSLSCYARDIGAQAYAFWRISRVMRWRKQGICQVKSGSNTPVMQRTRHAHKERGWYAPHNISLASCPSGRRSDWAVRRFDSLVLSEVPDVV